MKTVAAAVTLVIVVAACGSADEGNEDTSQFPPGAIAIVANADIAVGSSRLVVAVAEGGGRRLGSPDDAIALEVAPDDQPDQRQRVDGAFVWIVEGSFGLYRAEFNFDRPGIWRATVVPSSGVPLEPTLFAVNEDNIAPGVGDSVPTVPTPTAADAPLGEISTDPEPDPRFYELSLADAAASGVRTVAVFSTPAFCRTATCGPLLEQTKALAPQYPGVNFVHVEIYKGFNEPDFVPDGDHLADAVTASGWNLPSEPWVFVIDESGLITHRFEGVMDPSELRAALG
jgi:hypothetical protein